MLAAAPAPPSLPQPFAGEALLAVPPEAPVAVPPGCGVTPESAPPPPPPEPPGLPSPDGGELLLNPAPPPPPGEVIADGKARDELVPSFPSVPGPNDVAPPAPTVTVYVPGDGLID